MNPTLFDVEPAARSTDPAASHAAARTVRPANNELVAAIRAVVRAAGPTTQHTIAQCVMEDHPGRWQADTIRTACNPSRSGLVLVGNTNDDGVTGRGYGIYDLKENV